LGIRGVTPVFNEGKHLGSVEFGLSLGNELLESFKTQNKIEASLYTPEKNGFKLYASTWDATIENDTQQLKNIMSGEPEVVPIDVAGRPYAVYLSSVKDVQGKSVGVIALSMDRSQYMSEYISKRNNMLILALLALIIGLIIFNLLSKGIVGPLKRSADRMEDIASGEGDLTQRLLDNGNDEVTTLAKGFNQFIMRIQQLIQQVLGSTEQMATAAEKLTTITAQTSDGVQRQKNEIDQVATAMTEMSSTVHEVARNALAASEAAKNAADETSAGHGVVNDTIQSINELADEVQRASGVINNLATDSEAIGSVLDVIRGIAEQTNLLALNAAIEAARAGEQGRGFAVVADEVRILAQRTQTSTQEIQSMIEKVQEGAKNAVNAMESGKERAADSVNKASEAGKSLDIINSSVIDINDMNTQIASAAEQQSAVAEEINRNIVNIGSVADETASGSEQIALASRNLAHLGADLKSVVDMFKV